MFTGALTKATNAAAAFSGTIHSAKFDIAIQLEIRAKMSDASPDYDITAKNRSGRIVRIGSAWLQDSKSTGNPYISMQIDVGLGPFRVNAVQTQEKRAVDPDTFVIIPFIGGGTMKSGSISGGLTAMYSDNAFTGYVANMMFDLEFMLIENDYKVEQTHPDYRIEVSSPHDVPYMFSSMCRRSTPQKLIDERAFPVRVKVLIPELGLGARSETIYAWLDTHIARENYVHHAGGRTGLGGVSHYYFRDTPIAHQFARFLTELGLELADGTTCITYTSPSLPFGRQT